MFTLTIGSVLPDKVCTCKPTSVTYSSVFVVDLSCVKSIDDLRADDNGAWLHSGKPRRKYKVKFDSSNREIVSATVVNKESNSDDEYTLVRIYHHHKATPEFQRHICYVIDSTGHKVQYAVVQYLFEDGVEVPIVLPPHGNSKTATAYRRTQPSTLKKIKEERGKPKTVISNVYKQAGGSTGALSASELPRDRRQVYNARQHSSSSSMKDGRADPLFELIKMCKEDLLPGGRKFIRHVSIDSSPSCVLATDAQLANIRRFCTIPGEACVLGIDPTFNLGKFYVTVTTYTYLHVESKISHSPPTFFGPMFVHTEKKYETYYHFFSTLLKLEPKICDIVAVGTDGEQAIVKSLEALFPDNLIHLRCFVHMRDNIRRKLSDMLFPHSAQNIIFHDIFGLQQGSVYTKGLVDAMSISEFEQNLDNYFEVQVGGVRIIHSSEQSSRIS